MKYEIDYSFLGFFVNELMFSYRFEYEEDDFFCLSVPEISALIFNFYFFRVIKDLFK